ncbi:MAG: M48 family metalloprotease [Candidatus Aminicenantes bacterium]|nr:MAG: M48 family metalloprotease [Candidatus Aminicenantes bacterium]
MKNKRQSGIKAATRKAESRILYCLLLALLFFVCPIQSSSPYAPRFALISQEEPREIEFDFIPERDEATYSQRITSEIEREAVILRDESLNDYLDRIGKQIIDRNNLQELVGDWEWSFRIFDSSDVNAFATLGGQVYLSSGMIEAIESESELAAVLSFELGHIIAGHIHQHIYESLVRQTDFSSDEKLTGEEGWEKLSEIFMSEGGILTFFSNHRHTSLEVEKTDELALLNNYNAEFNPRAFLSLLSRLGRRERDLPQWLNRNPWNQRRRRNISSRLSSFSSLTSPSSQTRFREFKARLGSVRRPFFREEERRTVSGQEMIHDVTVMGDSDWTDTGIEVQEGQEISFSAFGTVYLQRGNIKAYCGPDGYDLRTRQQPFADRNIGALIGKVSILLSIEIDEGSGREIRHEIKEKFYIGSDDKVRMPISGRLYLGINEDLVADNEGAFSVNIIYLPIRFFPSL